MISMISELWLFNIKIKQKLILNIINMLEYIK
uniref:Uncharacterized protein n=1 Tax=viral metagenome TaxID=1070528 RepID=A0A6C0LK82_9ZZZZ